jgi:hypothetical protein
MLQLRELPAGNVVGLNWDLLDLTVLCDSKLRSNLECFAWWRIWLPVLYPSLLLIQAVDQIIDIFYLSLILCSSEMLV